MNPTHPAQPAPDARDARDAADTAVPVFHAQPVQTAGLRPCLLGEGVTWSGARGELLWTDIEGRGLWGCAPHTQAVRHWPLPERLASFALTPDPDRLLAAFAHQLAWLDLRRGRIEPLAPLPRRQGVRANDGRCDRAGHFVFGEFDDSQAARPQGRWWRYSRADGLRPLGLPPVRIANGLGFAPDGRHMHWCDSAERLLRRGAYDADRGDIAEQAPLARVEAGEPDGATVDALGQYWSAHWGAGTVLGYAPDGRVIARITLPASQPSCVAFGGADLRTLYITTARTGLAAEQLAHEPAAGLLHAVTLPWAGLPEPLFGQPG